MFCNLCGKPVPDGSVFCPSCGKRISAISETPQPEASFSIPWTPPPIPQVQPQATHSQSPEKQGLSGLQKRGLVVLGVLFLLLFGVFASAAYEENQKATPEKIMTSEMRRGGLSNNDAKAISDALREHDGTNQSVNIFTTIAVLALVLGTIGLVIGIRKSKSKKTTPRHSTTNPKPSPYVSNASPTKVINQKSTKTRENMTIIEIYFFSQPISVKIAFIVLVLFISSIIILIINNIFI